MKKINAKEDFVILVYITFPNKSSATRISEILIKEKLAACANIFPVRSVYRWKNKIEKTSEHVAIVKTNNTHYKKLEARVRELHPYKLPAIFVIPVKRGYEKYIKWAESAGEAGAA